MKRILALALSLLMIVTGLTACNNEPKEEATTKAPVETTTEKKAEEVKMDGIQHILFFESNLSKLEAKDGAYALKDFIKENFKIKEPAGTVTICAIDGYKTEADVKDIINLSISTEGEDAPTFVGDLPSKKLAVRNMLYIQFENEVIYFANTDYTFDKVVENLGLDETKTFTFKASDGFEYDAADAEDLKKAEVKSPKTTGESVNVHFYSMPKPGGADLRDCVSVTIK